MTEDNTTVAVATTTTIGLVVAILALALKFCNCMGQYRCSPTPGGCGLMCRDRLLPDAHQEMRDAYETAKEALNNQIAQLTRQVDQLRTDSDRAAVNTQRFYEESVRRLLLDALDDMRRAVSAIARPEPPSDLDSLSSQDTDDGQRRLHSPSRRCFVINSDTAATLRARQTRYHRILIVHVE